MERFKQKLQAAAIPFRENEPLAAHCTFKIGGPAQLFVMPENEQQLCSAVALCKEQAVRYYLLGNGSNILFADEGFSGVVIDVSALDAEIAVEDTVLTAGAGVRLAALCKAALKHGLSGLEFAAGIPGTLLGAVFMNANGYGSKFANVVHSVRTVTRDGRQEKHYTLEEIQYGDSDSVFMHNGDIVLEVVFDLKEGNPEEIKAVMDEYQASRRAKQPLEKRSAGPMFLRPPGHYVGPMIKGCDLMGFAIGDAQVSTKHPDFVVNNGKASAADILAVLHEVQRRVQEKYHVHLPLDVRMMGEDFPQE